MNKRILELAEQAGYDPPELEGKANRFAELIAMDCAKVCEGYAAKVLRFSQFGSNGARDCANLIKEHFGVES